MTALIANSGAIIKILYGYPIALGNKVMVEISSNIIILLDNYSDTFLVTKQLEQPAQQRVLQRGPGPPETLPMPRVYPATEQRHP